MERQEVIFVKIVYLLFLIGACVCFGIAAFAGNRVRFGVGWLGLLLFALVPTIQMLANLDGAGD